MAAPLVDMTTPLKSLLHIPTQLLLTTFVRAMHFHKSRDIQRISLLRYQKRLQGVSLEDDLKEKYNLTQK